MLDCLLDRSPVPCDLTRVESVAEYVSDTLGREMTSALLWGHSHYGEFVGYLSGSHTAVNVPVEDHLNVWAFIVLFQRKALAVIKPHLIIPERRSRAYVVPFFDTGYTPCLQAAIDGLVLAPAHKQPELKVFFVELVQRVIHLVRRDYQRACYAEGLSHDALIYAVASRKTFQFHDQNSVPAPLLNVRKQTLHLRTRGNSLTADDLFVYLAYGIALGLRKRKQCALMSGKSLPLTQTFQLRVGS